jgi:bifunctional non-homologous end joining protein LigD
MPKKLDEYEKKRDFKKTSEPKPRLKETGKGIFIVQEHSARRHHYDLRLEHDGVLKSWAVPRKPSSDPSVKRLAIQTEDHPLDYKDFEGVIPEGQYGAGTVVMWDKGTFALHKENLGLMIEKGHIVAEFFGQRMRGNYALQKLKKDGKEWLLVKVRDEFTEEKKDEGPGAPSNLERIGLTKEDNPGFIKPMLATLSEKPFSDDGWIFERKLDGFRCIAVKKGDDITLYSRNMKSLNVGFPEIVDILKKMKSPDFILDGELVVKSGGKISFEKIQERLSSSPNLKNKAYFYVFDLLHYNGFSLRALKLSLRKKMLDELLDFRSTVKVLPTLEKDGQSYFQEACRKGWEGIIGKNLGSPYLSKRSPLWKKIKCSLIGKFVVGGYTDPKGSRSGFGALLLGTKGKGGIIYNGKVGTGFDEARISSIHQDLKKIETEKNPFAQKIKEKDVHFVKPKHIAEVRYTEITRDGQLRHPVFLRMEKQK